MTEEKRLYADNYWTPKYLHIVAIGLCAALLVTQVLTAKVVQIGDLVFSSGTLIFPFCLIFGDIMTEVYGFKRARQVIFIVLLCRFFYAGMTQLVIALPHSEQWAYQEHYEIVFSTAPRILVAGALAYLAAELTNSWIMSVMKTRTKGKKFKTRAVVSTFFGELVNTAVFIPIVFLGTLSLDMILKMIITGTLIKTIIEIIILPFTMMIVHKLKALEGVDYYDHKAAV